MIIQTKGDVVRIKGSLFENQWPAIKSAVRLVLDDHPGGAIIDCSDLSEVTESGARTFLDASNFIQAHSSRVIVSGLSEDIAAEIRKIPGVRSQLVLAPTVEEARASLQSTGETALAERKTKPTVLLPLIGSWAKALDFAAAEANRRRAEVHVLYVIQVPRNLPLGATIPEKEQEAQQNLLEADKALRRKGVQVHKRATRARDIIEGVAKFASETKPDLFVVAYSKEELAKEGSRLAMIDTFCQDVPCDVAFFCVG